MTDDKKDNAKKDDAAPKEADKKEAAEGEAEEPVEKKALRDQVWFQPVILGVLALVSAALLAGGDMGTRDAIKQRKAEDLQRSLSQVIPAEAHDNNVLEDTVVLETETGPITVYRGTKDGAVTAAAFSMLTLQGYSGAITVLVGISPDGTMLGARVLAHAETPGLGDKIEVNKDDWILGFNGLSLGNPPVEQWGVKKDGGIFDQFSGATITPRAVVGAVKAGLELFEARKDMILAPKAPAEKPDEKKETAS